MSKYVRISARPINQQIAHQIDKEFLKEMSLSLPPVDKMTTMELSLHNCAFGHVLIGTDRVYLKAVELGVDPDQCYRNFINRWSRESIEVIPRVNQSLVEKVLRSIDTGNVDPSIQVSLRGTWFQRKVLEAVNMIPFGQTMTYGEIAKQINRPDSARAVGNALGQNPIAIIVPCHRAVRSDGKMSGYKWGEDIRDKLMTREA
jgi:AraC family transcriptional regulator of adaptative response/methylated-DNA-[protein]-cysteine methyltransferase